MAKVKATVTPKPKTVAAPKSKTPVLDELLVSKPHQNGWNKVEAARAAAEFASLVNVTDDVTTAITLMKRYVPIAGWKGPVKHLALKVGVITNLGRD